MLAAGTYHLSHPLPLSHGGTSTSPLVIRGEGHVVLEGGRASPWKPGQFSGRTVFGMARGADHVRFESIGFRDVGVAVKATADLADLCMQDDHADNVRRFIDTLAEHGATASIAGLTMRRIAVLGYSKGAVRLQYDTREVLLEDLDFDSQRQDGDNFAMGVHLDGHASQVVVRRVQARNSQDTRAHDKYWNGDGFATERGVSHVLFDDSEASGNTDGGFDLKSSATMLLDTRSQDNKRNYRLWADDMVVQGCTASTPDKRGGIGAAAQVWLGAGARVVMTGCTIEHTPASAVVHDLSEGAHLVVSDEHLRDNQQAHADIVGRGASVSVR